MQQAAVPIEGNDPATNGSGGRLAGLDGAIVTLDIGIIRQYFGFPIITRLCGLIEIGVFARVLFASVSHCRLRLFSRHRGIFWVILCLFHHRLPSPSQVY